MTYQERRADESVFDALMTYREHHFGNCKCLSAEGVQVFLKDLEIYCRLHNISWAEVIGSRRDNLEEATL